MYYACFNVILFQTIWYENNKLIQHHMNYLEVYFAIVVN